MTTTPRTSRAVWLPDSSGFHSAMNDGRDTLRSALRAGLASLGDGRRVRLGSRVCRDVAGRSLLVTRTRTATRGSSSAIRARSSCARRCRCPRAASRAARVRGGRLAAGVRFSSPTEPHDVFVYDLDAHALDAAHREPARRRSGDARRTGATPLRQLRRRVGSGFLFEPTGRARFPSSCRARRSRVAGAVPEFAPLTQHLVSRGYAVAVPNVRGSTGYGKRYEHLDDIEKRLDSVRDLASLHEWLSARQRSTARGGPLRPLLRRLHGARRPRVPA